MKLKMKAKVFEIKRLAVHDGDGLRTTVFLKGCPLKCVWCHNPEGLSNSPELAYYEHKCINCGECISVCPTGAHKMENGVHMFEREKCIACGKCESVCLGRALTFYGKEYTAKELLPLLLEDKAFYENSGGGVTISGGECLLYADFCAELLALLKQNGVNTAVDTSGFVSKTALEKVVPFVDVFLYDIKAFNAEVHKTCTGYGNEQILENLKYLDSLGCKIEVRIPFVPNFNDSEIEKIGKFLSELKNIIKVRVLPYHNYAGSKYDSLEIKNTLPSRLPTNEEVENAVSILKQYGLNVI